MRLFSTRLHEFLSMLLFYVNNKWILTCGIFIFIYVLAHFYFELTFPFPYPDEFAFYYPAKAFALNNNFFATELNTSREVFWMPPGYMVILGIWFKLTGPSIIAGRFLSMIFAVLLFTVLARLFYIWKFPMLTLVLLGIVFLSKHWIVIGNMIRMEGLVLFCCLCCYYLLQSEKYLSAISLCALSILIHPIAIYFFLVYCMICFSSGAIYRKHYKWELVVFIVCVTMLVWYGIYVLTHFNYFINDWTYQLHTRSKKALLELLFRPDQILFFILFGGILLVIYRFDKKKYLPSLVIALTLIMARILGLGYTYGIFRILGVVVIFACILALLNEFFVSKLLHTSCFFAICCVLIVTKVLALPSEKSLQASFCQITKICPPPMNNIDISIIGKKLDSLCVKEKSRFYFSPPSEAIVFDQIDIKWEPHMHVFDSARYDGFILHLSPYLDNQFSKLLLKENCIHCDTLNLGKPFYHRSNEAWYFYQ